MTTSDDDDDDEPPLRAISVAVGNNYRMKNEIEACCM